ncbi:MAG TPA: S-layer homology domain-containing protein [Candidatus Peribacteraceae bacterium]|nr:S-layer homology domain-containing protein [Candidatus Peribacteraceae bacterium]
MATLLQALDVRRFWAHGDLFRDVRKTTPYASCIETAAQDGIVSGFTDAEGKPTGEFGPDRPVNRAEMSKIISTSADLYIETDAS